MGIEQVGTTGDGKYKIYKDTSGGSPKMGYRGISRMAGDKPSFDLIRNTIDGAVQTIRGYPADKPINRDELLGFLGMLRELTEEAPGGYFYCPYNALEKEPQVLPPDHWSHKLAEKLKKQVEEGGPSYLELSNKMMVKDHLPEQDDG